MTIAVRPLLLTFGSVLGFILLPTLGSAQTKAQLQEMYMTYLDKEQDLEPFIDSDGDVQFSYQDRGYFIQITESDPEFFRLVLPNIWPIESENEYLQALNAVHEVNKDLKVVKAYIVNETNVWVGVELFLDELDDYEAIFERSLKVIEDGVEKYVEAMREE